MFFIFSKILAFLISPLTWVFSLFVWARFTKIETRKRKLIITSVTLLYLFCNSFISDEFMRAWEYASEDLRKNEHYDYAIVLSGMITYDARLDEPIFRASSDRLWQTLRLLKTGQVDRMIISGGSGSINHPDHKEAAILKKYLLRIGVPDSAVIIENESKNTHENAVNTKKIVDSLHIHSKMLFVTSAFHMRRSIGCFNKVGITNIRPFCTDRYSGARKYELDHLFIPNPGALGELTLIIHEVTGYLVYKIRGYA